MNFPKSTIDYIMRVGSYVEISKISKWRNFSHIYTLAMISSRTSWSSGCNSLSSVMYAVSEWYTRDSFPWEESLALQHHKRVIGLCPDSVFSSGVMNAFFHIFSSKEVSFITGDDLIGEGGWLPQSLCNLWIRTQTFLLNNCLNTYNT